MNLYNKALFVFAILLSACASNPFGKFYTDVTVTVSPEMVASRLEPPSGSTLIYSGSDPKQDTITSYEQGYVLIGYSSFVGAIHVTKEELMAQAKKVGADLVIFYSQYSHTETGIAPVPTYHSGTTATTNFYGAYSGSAVTTTSGSFGIGYIPYQAGVYNYGATFWRKGKPPTLGVIPAALPDDLRKELQRNTGILTLAVVNDSPAFMANIIVGDVIIKIGDTELTSIGDYPKILQSYKGKDVPVTYIRDGKEATVNVQMN
jgi:membrane-associated protease RseP (regulator of RpoE activity)